MMNSPITITDKISEQITKQIEDAVMLKVRESCNIEIDKKALFDAISKSTPMKPRPNNRNYECCPVCNEVMKFRRIYTTGQEVHKYPNYCSHCGQRIDWEIENDKL